MASNVLSRLLPSAIGEPSIYETLQQYDEAIEHSDLDSEGELDREESNARSRYQQREIHIKETSGVDKVNRSDSRRQRIPQGPTQDLGQPAESRTTPKTRSMDDLDDEVPQSLLIEDDHIIDREPQNHHEPELPAPVPGPPTRNTRARWQATQQQQRLHGDEEHTGVHSRPRGFGSRPLGVIHPKEQATWMWANVQNLDRFLNDVYEYYLGHGIRSILLNRSVKLL